MESFIVYIAALIGNVGFADGFPLNREKLWKIRVFKEDSLLGLRRLQFFMFTSSGLL